MHGRKRTGAALVLLLAIASLAVAATAFARVDAPAATAATSAACESPKIGFMGPITGEVAFIGEVPHDDVLDALLEAFAFERGPDVPVNLQSHFLRR